MDHSKMKHDAMPNGDNPPMGHAGHNHHAMMIGDFRKRFYLVLILTISIMLLSTMIQNFVGVNWQFTGSSYILSALSTIVFIYGGWPFLKGPVSELKEKPRSSVVSAAQGKVKIKKDNNSNYGIKTSITNLAEPNRLQPPKKYLCGFGCKLLIMAQQTSGKSIVQPGSYTAN